MFSRPSSNRSGTYDRRAGPDLAEPFLVGEHQPDLLREGEAFADQLLVAVLEDVQRDLLGREQHGPEREEAEFRHGARPFGLEAGGRPDETAALVDDKEPAGLGCADEHRAGE